MRIGTPQLVAIPNPISAAMRACPPAGDGSPGLIISTQHLGPHSPPLIVEPGLVSQVFKYSAELDLLKSITDQITDQATPTVKFINKAVWLVFGAAQLRHEWQQPEADKLACAFKLTRLALSTADAAGTLAPALKLGDAWLNGVNFVLDNGQAMAEGKTPDVADLLYATDKRMDIPQKLLKLAELHSAPPPAGGLQAGPARVQWVNPPPHP